MQSLTQFKNVEFRCSFRSSLFAIRFTTRGFTTKFEIYRNNMKKNQKRNVRFASHNGYFQTELHFHVDWIKRVHVCPVAWCAMLSSAVLCSVSPLYDNNTYKKAATEAEKESDNTLVWHNIIPLATPKTVICGGRCEKHMI